MGQEVRPAGFRGIHFLEGSAIAVRIDAQSNLLTHDHLRWCGGGTEKRDGIGRLFYCEVGGELGLARVVLAEAERRKGPFGQEVERVELVEVVEGVQTESPSAPRARSRLSLQCALRDDLDGQSLTLDAPPADLDARRPDHEAARLADEQRPGRGDAPPVLEATVHDRYLLIRPDARTVDGYAGRHLDARIRWSGIACRHRGDLHLEWLVDLDLLRTEGGLHGRLCRCARRYEPQREERGEGY